jgi:hypothetical protein
MNNTWFCIVAFVVFKRAFLMLFEKVDITSEPDSELSVGGRSDLQYEIEEIAVVEPSEFGYRSEA